MITSSRVGIFPVSGNLVVAPTDRISGEQHLRGRNTSLLHFASLFILSFSVVPKQETRKCE